MRTLPNTYPLSASAQLEIVKGDLTQEAVDAIVNAANANLAHGGGVAGAILQAGGPVIQEESEAWIERNGLVTHAEPAYTSAGRLRARYVIHAVGPIWGEGEEDRKLEAAVRGSLERAEALGLQSIAFPAISTGIFGFPKDRAARVILQALRKYFQQQPGSSLLLVRVTLREDETFNTFLSECQRIFQP